MEMNEPQCIMYHVGNTNTHTEKKNFRCLRGQHFGNTTIVDLLKEQTD